MVHGPGVQAGAQGWFASQAKPQLPASQLRTQSLMFWQPEVQV